MRARLITANSIVLVLGIEFLALWSSPVFEVWAGYGSRIPIIGTLLRRVRRGDETEITSTCAPDVAAASERWKGELVFQIGIFLTAKD